MKKTVRLFIYLPNQQQVVLSRRSKHEKHGGILQSTVYGMMEPGEIPEIAMKREFAEEGKGDFHDLYNKKELGKAKVGTTTPEETTYFCAMLSDDHFSDLQTTQEISEFVLVKESDIKSIKNYSDLLANESEIDLFSIQAMFDDELTILKKYLRFIIIIFY